MAIYLVVFAVIFIVMVIAVVKLRIKLKNTKEAAEAITEEEIEEFGKLTEE